MLRTEILTLSPKTRKRMRAAVGVLVVTLLLFALGAVAVIKSKERLLYFASESGSVFAETPPFPIGVNPQEKIIVEQPEVDVYFQSHIANVPERVDRKNFWQKAVWVLARSQWYQNLASPISRVLIVWPGERKEQVAKSFADILKWTNEEQATFIALVSNASPKLEEGKFFPGRYLVDKDATPEEVATILIQEFNTEVLSRYSDDIAMQIPLEDTLTIAGLIEREALNFNDMRHISGVIWNRLFEDMHLQIDASLQYVRGSKPSEPAWWPQVKPRDKFIDSPFNTYQNDGLPPAPISNPSPEAILAALNPRETPCFFYFHDEDGGFYCSPTYEEHVELLKGLYGRGR